MTTPVAAGAFRLVFAVEPQQVRLVVEGDADTISAAVDEIVERWSSKRASPNGATRPSMSRRAGRAAIFRSIAVPAVLRGARLWRPPQRLPLYRRRECICGSDGGRPTSASRPNKLDNIVRGGIGNATHRPTLIKESEEEGGIPESLVRHAVPVGAVTYCMRPSSASATTCCSPTTSKCRRFRAEEQRRRDRPFQPDAGRRRRRAGAHDRRFKFNVNLVILDFALRMG